MAVMGALSPNLRAAGVQLLKLISSKNWSLEWNLPGWLGEAFDLHRDTTSELILGNIYGLAYVRLQDDLFDNEVRGEWKDAISLAKVLHTCWIAQYRSVFDRLSSFWNDLDTYTGEWLRATLETDGPSGAELQSGKAWSMQRLAQRGAPLKICCTAACLLAGRETILAQLLAAVDHLLAGAVLVDHFGDWQVDLMAGRYNAFVAFIAQSNDGDLDKDSQRRAVLHELYLGSAARSYFELAQQQFLRAQANVQDLGIGKLEAYLVWAASETAAHHARVAQAYSQHLQMAARDLLQSMDNDLLLQTMRERM